MNSNELIEEGKLGNGIRHDLLDEMRQEAVARMKSIRLYKELIDSFEEDWEPMVYEPPYGAGYILEEDELEKVRHVEAQHNVLVWGVIRCFMKYSGMDIVIDNMLYVGHIKENWPSEREDLASGIPHVYTYCEQLNLYDSGSINIFMSLGGTPLRR